MDLIVISGLSGAGKSTAAGLLEDLGYYCIDNLPAPLLEALILELSKGRRSEAQLEQLERVALVLDVRSARYFGSLEMAIRQLQRAYPQMRLLFYEADERILLSRYKQSRRNHPLARKQSLADALREERELMAPIKALASHVMDSSEWTTAELRQHLDQILRVQGKERLAVWVQSFGFKYGLPLDCDAVWDVRFIPNPYYEAALRQLSGLDQPVCDFIARYPETDAFVEKVIDFYRFALPLYEREGKVRFNIAIGCTGGRHRSVALAERLAAAIREMNYEVFLSHRDIRKDPQRGL